MKSKYKNPDKYIAKLKSEIIRLEYLKSTEERYTKSFIGEQVVSWIKGIIHESNCSTRTLGDFKVNDKIRISGTITEVREYIENGQEKSEISFEEHAIYKVTRV